MIDCQNSGIIARSLILVLVLLIRHVSLNVRYDNMFAMISVGMSFKLKSGLLCIAICMFVSVIGFRGGSRIIGKCFDRGSCGCY